MTFSKEPVFEVSFVRGDESKHITTSISSLTFWTVTVPRAYRFAVKEIVLFQTTYSKVYC